MESFKTLIKEFGERLNAKGLEVDDQGYIALTFDDKIIHLQYDDQLDEVVIFTRLGKIEPNRMQDICLMLLSANMFWQGSQGATFSVEPTTGMVLLADRKALGLINVLLLNDWLERFLNTAGSWRERLNVANNGCSLNPEVDKARNLFGSTEFISR